MSNVVGDPGQLPTIPGVRYDEDGRHCWYCGLYHGRGQQTEGAHCDEGALKGRIEELLRTLHAREDARVILGEYSLWLNELMLGARGSLAEIQLQGAWRELDARIKQFVEDPRH